MPRFDAVRVVFLDIDNTLYDYEGSLALHVEEVRRAFEPSLGRLAPAALLAAYWRGYAAVPDEEKRDLLRRDVDLYRRRVWEAALATIDGALPDAADVARTFSRLRDSALPPYPGAVALVRALRRSRRVGVISNGPGHLQRRKLAALGVGPLVDPDLVFISHEFGCDKPDSRIFRAALAAAREEPSACLMVGDDAVNDHGAAKVGMRFVLFRGNGGEAPALDPPPDAVATSHAEIAALLGVRVDGA